MRSFTHLPQCVVEAPLVLSSPLAPTVVCQTKVYPLAKEMAGNDI